MNRIISMIFPLAMTIFLLYSYLWVVDNVGFERSLVILLFFSFLGLGGVINNINSTLQKKNFKMMFSEKELCAAVLGLRAAREKEKKKFQRNEFLDLEVKVLKLLVDCYGYEPLKPIKEVIAEERAFQKSRG